MHELAVMDKTGDTKTIWNPDDEDEVDNAKATFDRLKTRGFLIFRVDKDGGKAKRMEKFDPGAAKMIAVPVIVGGLIVPTTYYAISSTATWDVWISSSTSTTCTSTTDTIWTGWATCTSGTTTSDMVYGGNHHRREPTQAELEAQAIQEAHWKMKAEERAVVEAKAEELLLASVSHRQASQYRRLRWFTVQGASGAVYRVRKGRVGNVDRVSKDGAIEQRFCAHPADSVPDCDTMLAQALMLEVDDLHFCGLANQHGAGGDRVPVAELRH